MNLLPLINVASIDNLNDWARNLSPKFSMKCIMALSSVVFSGFYQFINFVLLVNGINGSKNWR